MKFHLPWKREQEKKEYTLIYDGNGGRQNGERFVRRSFWLPDGGFGKEKKFVSNTDGGDLTVETVFSNSNLKCIGYYARKRTEEGWIWYGTDHNWHDSFYDGTVCKQLIPIAASVESLYEAADDEIYLVAQWEDEHGIRRNCGYEIFSKKLMAHAFGGMDGTTYHNTAEAFEHGKKEGYQSFEIDLSYTEDDRLVLCHGWTENNCKCTGVSYKPEFAHMTYEQAMQIPIHGHSIMDARQFYEKVKNEPAYTFEIDFHNIKKGNEKRVAAMLEDFRQDEGLLDRLLMQVYSQPMYHQPRHPRPVAALDHRGAGHRPGRGAASAHRLQHRRLRDARFYTGADVYLIALIVIVVLALHKKIVHCKAGRYTRQKP